MSWQQLVFDSDREQAPHLEELLVELGALSVSLLDNADDPVLEPGVGETPLWQSTRLLALFGAETDINRIILDLQEKLQPLPPWRAEVLVDQAWERAWMADFQPMRFGQRLWICPSWCAPPDANAVNLALDPGLAFGTGTHPTTALCLEWLDAQSLDGTTLLDYGCGSGILAIAALLLGAARALAVDNDPQALIATRDNALRNGIAAERLLTYLPEQVPADLQAQVVVANILAGPLQSLAPLLSRYAAPQGRIALSGILASQAELVSAAYADQFQLTAPAQRQEWVRLQGQKAGQGNS